jgi:thiazole/oxazole-forming peptide maturase SagC family component
VVALEDPSTQSLALTSTARILQDDAGRFRIRTGVWNFEEAVIDVSRESEAVARTVRAALGALAEGPTSLGEHLDPELLPIERANVERLFVDLAQAGVVVPVQERLDQQAITGALLGRLSSPYPGVNEPPSGEVLFWSDTPAAVESAQRLAESLRLRLSPMPEELTSELSRTDLLSRIDGYTTERETARLRGLVSDAAAVVTVFQRPLVPTLRALNRLLDDQSVPWITGFVDGPFVTLLGLKHPYTGCFECFEQRSLARLEDHVAYHEFVGTPVPQTPPQDTDAPMTHLLTSLAVTEGYLHAALGTSRMMGRALGIHLPTFEIQVQDLLRMPNCPCCGRVSRQRLREINFNSRAVVDRVVSEVLR